MTRARSISAPTFFARKNSGSYYTPDDLVLLILDETLAPLIADAHKAFTDRLASLKPGGQRGLQAHPAAKSGPGESDHPAARLRSGYGIGALPCQSGGPAHQPRAQCRGRGRRARHAGTRSGIRKPRIRGSAQGARHHPGQCRGCGLDRCRGTIGRSPTGQAHGAQTLRLWRGQEPDGGGARQGCPMAAHLHGRGAPVIHRSPSGGWGQPVRTMGARCH